MCRTEPGQKLKIRYAVDIHAECGGAQRMCGGGRGEGSTKRYGQCSRRQPGYFPECVHLITGDYNVKYSYSDSLKYMKTLSDSSSSPHFYSCCCLSLLFSLLFVSSPENSSFILTLFSQFSLSPSLSLSRRSHLTFPVLLSSNSLNIFGAVGTYFSITVPLITSVVLFLSTGMWTPSPLPT